MSIIENAVADFRQKITNTPLSIEVPEWKATIYYKRSWSLKAQEPVNRLTDQGKRSEAIVQALIIRALDEDGNKMFRNSDMTELMSKVDPDVISRIMIEMNKDEVDLEEAEKN